MVVCGHFLTACPDFVGGVLVREWGKGRISADVALVRSVRIFVGVGFVARLD